MTSPNTSQAMLDEIIAGSLPPTNTLFVNLANAILAAYTAYNNGTTPSVSGYQYVTSIWVQESEPDAETLERNVAEPKPQAGGLSLRGNTLIGFSAYANDRSHNIIVLRGTVTKEEAFYDLYGWGTNTACMLPTNNPTQSYGNVKQDLYDFYTGTDRGLFQSLAASFNSAVQKVAQANPGKPWIVAAHSLGGALATLGALDAYVSRSNGNTTPPSLVTFGSLHIGDKAFAVAFAKNIATAYRFANLCDFVPSLVSLEPATWPDPYVHVGLECTFAWQKWDDWANHSMENIYLATVRDYYSVIKAGPRKYPQ